MTLLTLVLVEPFEGAGKQILWVGVAEELYRAQHKKATVVVVALARQVLER